MTHGHPTQRTRLPKALLLQSTQKFFGSVQACSDVPRNRAAQASEARPVLASERRESPLPSVRRGRSFANTSFRAPTGNTQIAAPSAPWSSEPRRPSTCRRPPTPCTHAPRRAPKRHSARLRPIGSSGAIFLLIGAAAPCPIQAKRDIGVGSLAPRAAMIFDTDGVQPLGQACGCWCTPWLP